MPPPLPPSELGHSLGARDARVTLGGHLDYIVRTQLCACWGIAVCTHPCSKPGDAHVNPSTHLKCICAVPIFKKNIYSHQEAGGTSLPRQEFSIRVSPSSSTVRHAASPSSPLLCRQRVLGIACTAS